MHRKVAAALVAALALGIASCGSSQPTLTRAQLVSRVEAACRAARTTTQQQMQVGGRSARASPARLIAAIAAGQLVVLKRIEALNPPDTAKTQFDDFKEATQQRSQVLARIGSAGAAGIQSAFRASQAEGEAITRRLHQAAAGLGVRHCA